MQHGTNQSAQQQALSLEAFILEISALSRKYLIVEKTGIDPTINRNGHDSGVSSSIPPVMRSHATTLWKGSSVMSFGLKSNCEVGATVLLLFLLLPSISLGAGAAIGPRGGYDFDTDNFVVGGEAEFGRVLEQFRFAPSVDLELGDNKVTALNGDFRLYLFNLPESGLRFYGSAGPTVLFASPDNGDTKTNLGLSLVVGVKIPMKGANRYNLETRFGFGDIPDLKLMLAVLFGI
jgi:hypothetical protein